MKKILSSLLALSVLFGSAAYLGNPETADMNFGTQAYAADIVKSGVCGENLTWTLDSEGLLSIKGTGEMTDWKYHTFSAEITGFVDVNFNGDPVPWFEDRDSIKRVEIGEGVTSVGNMAFIGTKAESVNLPDSITKIGEDAFCCCTYLQNINIPCNTEAIGEGAFYSCYSLESLDIPPSLKIIEDLAFCRCTCLTELDIPEGVEKIENYAFEYCTRLVSVNISASVNEIGSDAFKECFCLESVFIANPDCVIYDASDTFCNETKKFILYGYEGSTAQAYAEKYGYNFVAIMLGDADFDGAVNSSDASLILADYASSATGSGHILTAEELVIADVNSDNAVDASDASTVLAYYAYTATGGDMSLADFIKK